LNTTVKLIEIKLKKFRRTKIKITLLLLYSMVLSQGEFWTAWYSKDKEMVAFVFARQEATSLATQAVIDKRIQELLTSKVHRVYCWNCFIINNIDIYIDIATNKNSGWRLGEPTSEHLRGEMVRQAFEKFIIDLEIKKSEEN